MAKKFFSVDAETNGLRGGEHFAIWAVVADAKWNVIDTFEWRANIKGEVNTWVRDNVLPKLESMDITFDSEEELIKAFWDFWTKHKNDSVVVAHMPNPVETQLFDKGIEKYGFGWMFDGPYGIDTLETILPKRDSVDSYIQENNLTVPFDGETHHPMYDCLAALVAYVHIKSNQVDN